METSLTRLELSEYIKEQINRIFPDVNRIQIKKIIDSVAIALEKMENCLSRAALNRYKKDNKPYFNHLFSDSYMLFLCYLSNSIWKQTQDPDLSSKVYYLNKVLHSFDCMYDNNLPEIFFIVHGFGTMMGKAEYGNYLVVYQGCTIGANHGIYPKLGQGVTIASNSSVIGKSNIGDRATIGTRTTVFEKDIPNDSTAYIDYSTGILKVSKSKICYSQQFYNFNLNDSKSNQ